MKLERATRQAIAEIKTEARRTGCNGTGCDLVRWLRAGTRVSVNCSVCHRIFSADRYSPALNLV